MYSFYVAYLLVLFFPPAVWTCIEYKSARRVKPKKRPLWRIILCTRPGLLALVTTPYICGLVCWAQAVAEEASSCLWQSLWNSASSHVSSVQAFGGGFLSGPLNGLNIFARVFLNPLVFQWRLYIYLSLKNKVSYFIREGSFDIL